MIYTGFGVEKELSFYSLGKKQVPLTAPTAYVLFGIFSTNTFGTLHNLFFFLSLFLPQIIKKIAMPHWVSCVSLSCKSELIAVGSQGTQVCSISIMFLFMIQ